MDRRSIIGFALIFLIIWSYPIVMNKLYPPKPAPTMADTTMADTSVATGGEGAADAVTTEQLPTGFAPAGDAGDGASSVLTADEALAPAQRGAAGEVRIETPLYSMAISTAGGAVARWNGLAYESHEGGTVQLVPEDRPARSNEAVVFRAGQLDLADFVFVPDRDSIVLNEGSGAASLTLTARTRGGLEIRKIFTFRPDSYGVQVDLVVGAADGAAVAQTLALTGSPDVFRFGWNQGIAPTERIVRMEEASLRSLAKVGADVHYKKRDGLKKNVEKVEGDWRGSVQFAGLQSRYFTIMGIVPQEQGEPIEGGIRLSGDTETMAQSWAIDVPAMRSPGGDIATARLELFVGPQEADLLRAYGMGLEDTMDLGWKWVRPLSQAVLWSLGQMYKVIPNYGVIIIIFSILTKLMFYPLTKTSTESMKKMQELQPKLKALQEKYKNDKDKLNQATMKLYQEEKINPLAGCLPLLVQSPVFIALYQALNHTIALRGQPFVLWMDDLSQPDALATLPFSLPFLGADFNVLPILMSVAMYFQTKLTPSSGGGQMAAMNTMMPLIMIFIFYNMPSGLVLYWLVNTILQGYQTWKIHQAAGHSGGTATT